MAFANRSVAEEAPRVTIQDVRDVVCRRWGFDSFRPLQQQAIERVVTGRDSVVVLPTGGGKSLCFQAPAVCMDGMAVVVSPLISLMKDQVDALRANGVPAALYNSTLSPDERRGVGRTMRAGDLKLLYVAPESLLAQRMLSVLDSLRISFFAIDEAHCISSWGHDFRPEYRGLDVLRSRYRGVAIHAYTATATERVRQDIAKQLRLEEPAILVGSFDRPNLIYKIEQRTNGLGQICQLLDRHRGESGIVYCITRKDVDRTTAALASLGYRAAGYHAGMTDANRRGNQEAFLEEKIDVIVATVAFGMGIDKSNVRFVVHAGMPKSLEAYQQESGRAGRDGLEAECLLLYSSRDNITWRRILENSERQNPGTLDALRAMDSYCNAARCRHQALVEHFGQTLDQDDCQACDVCLGQIEQVDDPLVVAQKILSCIVRLSERFGADYTSQVLVGSRDQRILENKHERLSTYGILQKNSRGRIRAWIEQLVSQGCARKQGEYNVLHVTELGWQVLRGEVTPRLVCPASVAGDQANAPSGVDLHSWEGVDRELFASLCELRREIAGLKNIPPYVVFGDATLRDMARRRPSTRQGMLQVHGVGQQKCDDYGERFLQHIAAHCTRHGLERDLVPKSAMVAERSLHLNASAVAAFPYFRAGTSVAEVASRMGRAESTVYGYLDQYLRHEQIDDPSPWVAHETAMRVRQAIGMVGRERLKLIFDHLQGSVPYSQIRLVVACLDNDSSALDMAPGEA